MARESADFHISEKLRPHLGIGHEIELTVGDNGVGMKDKGLAAIPERHGADYVAIFVRQLSGTISVSRSEEGGTIVRVRLPLFVVSE